MPASRANLSNSTSECAPSSISKSVPQDLQCIRAPCCVDTSRVAPLDKAVRPFSNLARHVRLLPSDVCDRCPNRPMTQVKPLRCS